MNAADCELCRAEVITRRYHEDEMCWIAECESCSVPMVVWRRHDPQPAADERARLLLALRRVAEEVYGIADSDEGDRFWIDDRLRTIPDHYHAHARPRIPGLFAAITT